MLRRLYLIPALLLIGCASASPPDVTGEPTAPPTDPPTEVITETPTPTDTPSPTETPTITPSATPLPPLPPGLMVVTGEFEGAKSLWVVDATGTLRRLLENAVTLHYYAEFDISRDGTQILYALDGDIWVLDVPTGETRNVTNTPDRFDNYPRWWAGREGAFVMASFNKPRSCCLVAGMLTYGNVDGSYEVLDEAYMGAAPSPRPDGDTILYQRGPEVSGTGGFDLWEYRWGVGSRQIDPAELGLSEHVVDREGAPNFLHAGAMSWSSDGGTLGLALGGMFEGKPQCAIVTIDMATGEKHIAFLFTPTSIDAALFSSAPRFHPDGSTFAFEAWPEGTNGGMVFIGNQTSRPDVAESLPSATGSWAAHPSFSRDGRWIAYVTENQLAVASVDDWIPQFNSLPEPVLQVGWVQPPE